jgi:acetate kinase
MSSSILTIYGGSSSIKFALFDQVDPPRRSLFGVVERIGLANGVISAKGANCLLVRNEPFEAVDLEQAGGRLLDWLGFLIYLLRNERITAEQIAELVNKPSGMLGVSGISPDMKDLLDLESTEPHAAEAIELFCHQAAKYAAAMAVAAGGLDTLVFAAGIAERSPPVRERICARPRFLGVHIGSAHNAATAPVISPDGSPVTVRVIPTDEEITIARQTLAVAGAPGENES